MKKKSCSGAVAVAILSSALFSSAQPVPGEESTNYWFGSQSDGLVFVLELRSSGELRFIPETGVISKGRWKQDHVTITMELNSRFVLLSGTIEGDHLQGTATTRKGVHWTWSATREPEVVAQMAPSYPPLASAARISGTVLVDVEIDSDGNVTSARSIKAHPLLRDAATAAGKRYRFKPDEHSGIRTARLAFIFRDESMENPKPLILSPYQIAVSHHSLVIDKSYTQ